MKHLRSESPRNQLRDLPGHRTRLYGQLLLVALLLFPPPLWANTITVGGDCTLVEAIDTFQGAAAVHCVEVVDAAPNTIELSGDVLLTAADNTTNGANGLPVIESALVVKSDTAGVRRKIERDSAAATPAFRLFEVAPSGTLTTEWVELEGGLESSGGAIANFGTVALTNSTVTANTASYGGGVYSNNTLTLENTTVEGNDALGAYGGGGGLYVYAGTATLTDSTVANNFADYSGGGIGGLYYTGSLSLTNTTVSDNVSNGRAGGLFVGYNAAATLTNSTVSGNTAAGRGGGLFGWFTSTVGLVNSTLSGNSAGVAGGAIYVDDFGEGLVAAGDLLGKSSAADKTGGFSSITLVNTLVANSASGGNCAGHNVNVIDSGNNLADDTSCGVGVGTLTGLDPVLADNGGPTLTHALLCGSSAIDVANTSGLTVDQRRFARQDGLPDSGSYELQASDDVGPLYPIALSIDTVNGAAPGDLLIDVFNGSQPGNFGWLTWAGDPSVPVLATSLTPPGDSDTYVNPYDPADPQVSAGDWVQGSPGVSNARDIRDILDALIADEVVITVPVWDLAESAGNNTNYRVAGFAQIQITDYLLPRDNRISAIFVGLVDPGCP